MKPCQFNNVFTPAPKPRFKKRQKNNVSPEQYERIRQRANYCCECCGKPLVYTDSIRPDKAELHHIENKGIGGRPKKVYADWELMMLRLDCHDKEEAAGYPHRHSWIDMIKQKMGVVGQIEEE